MGLQKSVPTPIGVDAVYWHIQVIPATKSPNWDIVVTGYPNKGLSDAGNQANAAITLRIPATPEMLAKHAELLALIYPIAKTLPSGVEGQPPFFDGATDC